MKVRFVIALILALAAMGIADHVSDLGLWLIPVALLIWPGLRIMLWWIWDIFKLILSGIGDQMFR
ncbi:MAG TPA: hypothetical protein PLJ74_13340 [Myxococcota bacterium]|nr:hypothetical protein [Myxococcota bacterium]